MRTKFPAKAGYRPDCRIYFKSKMEANVFRYYKYLEEKRGRIHVQYEPERFVFRANRFNINSYVPDLKVTSDIGVWYIEVKGSMERSALQKAWLLSKNYSWVKLYFVLPEQYNKIKSNFSHLIKHWE